jgi:DNA invertase Pin-like site-specific DNA recombinase
MIPPLKKSTYIYSDAVSKNGVKLGRPRGKRNSRPITKRSKGHTKTAKKSTRKAGNPIGKSPPLSPEVSKRVAAMWLRGESLTSIAEQTGTHRSALARHVEAHIVPVFKQELIGEAIRTCALLKEAARIS